MVVTVDGCGVATGLVPVGGCVPVVKPEPDSVDDGGVDTDGDLAAAPGALPPVPGEPVELFGASGLAHATPGVVATAIPTPSATANAPTRPMCLAYRPDTRVDGSIRKAG
jgi:hypothetical protein